MLDQLAHHGVHTERRGETKTCTVTNDDQAAKLTVIKHVINDNGGTAVAFMDGVKPVHTLHIGDGSYTVYTGLLALAVNIVVALVVNAVIGQRGVQAQPQTATR